MVVSACGTRSPYGGRGSPTAGGRRRRASDRGQAGASASPRRRVGHTGRDDPGARVARSRVRSACAARDRATPRSRRSRPLSIGCLDDVRPGCAAGRDAGADRSRPSPARWSTCSTTPTAARSASSSAGRARWRSATCCPAGATSPSSPGVFHVGGPVRDRHRAVPRRLPRRRSPTPAARCAGWPATSTSSTSTATRPTCDERAHRACGSSPATPAGRPASSPARSPRAPGPACRAGPDDVLSAAAGPELWRAVMGRQTRPAGRALHRSRGSLRELTVRVPGSRSHLVGRAPGEGGLGKRPPSPAVSAGDHPAAEPRA